MQARYLSPRQAARIYDRIGRMQDVQFYEHRAIHELLTHADFEHAQAVCEFGFGTGRLAGRLLKRYLPESCRYLGIDVSPRMAALASKRLRRWRTRAEIRVGDGSIAIPADDGQFDRFVSTYVLDLLSPADGRALVAEAHRVLAPEGRLCLASLTRGLTTSSRLVTGAWERLWRLRPELVGGCRPVVAGDYLEPGAWTIRHRIVVSSFALSSEVVIATRRTPPN